MIILRFDNTFEGLLTLVFESYRLRLFPDFIVCDEEKQSMIFTDTDYIATDIKKAERIWNWIVRRTSKLCANQLYIVFLSGLEEAPKMIFDFIFLMNEKPYNIENDFSLDPVLEISRLFNKVVKEAARVRMFARFQQTGNNSYYASYSPVYDVLPLCIHHFMDRFADQEWIIYDLKRNYGFHYDLKETVRITFDNLPANPVDGMLPLDVLSQDEDHFQRLWRKYYETINIKERKNYRLHRQLLPKRFWRYLPEKN